MTDLIKLATKHGAFLNEGGHGIPAGTLITFEPEELEAFAAALAARPVTPAPIAQPIAQIADPIAQAASAPEAPSDGQIDEWKAKAADYDRLAELARDRRHALEDAQRLINIALGLMDAPKGANLVVEVAKLAALAAPSTPAAGQAPKFTMDEWVARRLPLPTQQERKAQADAIARVRDTPLAAPSTPSEALSFNAWWKDKGQFTKISSPEPADGEFEKACARAAWKASRAALAAPSTPAAEVDCPHCFAKAGEPCLWPETRETNRDHPHKAREALAATQAQASEPDEREVLWRRMFDHLQREMAACPKEDIDDEANEALLTEFLLRFGGKYDGNGMWDVALYFDNIVQIMRALATKSREAAP